MENLSGFGSYNKAVTQITHDLKKLREFSGDLKLDGNASAIDDALKRLSDKTFSVAIVGAFNRGKSTLINALLGLDVLPMSVLPCTATLNKITYDIDKFVEIVYKDGKTEKIDIGELNNYVTKLTADGENTAKSIKDATVHYPIRYCEQGVTIIDTPGLDDDEAMDDVALSVLPLIDAALVVIMAQAPFSESERRFLEEEIIASDLGRVLFVVTGIDQLDEEEVEKVLQHVTGSIQEKVIAKARNTFGEKSEEFENYKRKIGNVKVYGLSAKNALKAKMKKDDEKLKQSRFPEFETELERFLTEDRGAVTLSVPISRIKMSSVELVRAIELRESVLGMEEKEFEEKCKSAMEEIEKIKRERGIEFGRINDAADKTKVMLEPLISDFWPTAKKAAEAAVDAVEIKSLDELKEPLVNKTQEKVVAAVKNAVSLESRSITERIQAAIETELGKAVYGGSGFEESFNLTMAGIQHLFTDGGKAKNGKGRKGKELVLVAIDGLAGGFVGGMFKGFEVAGIKGLVFGGAAGLAGAVGAALLLALSLPVAFPAFITLTAAGLFGHFTGKWALGKVFAKDRIERFKRTFKDEVNAEIDRMISENGFSVAVRGQVDTAFDALKDRLKTETDNILDDLKRQLAEIKEGYAGTTAAGKIEREELERMSAEIKDIFARADGIGKQITEVLSK